MNAPGEGEITRAAVADAWGVKMAACRQCGFVHRRKRWDLYDRAPVGTPCWIRSDVDVEYGSLTAGRLASAKLPEAGPWVRRQALVTTWNVIWAIQACWPPECLTKGKVRSPRADVTMQEWCAWVTVSVGGRARGWPRGEVSVNREEARVWLVDALDRPREEILVRIALRVMR